MTDTFEGREPVDDPQVVQSGQRRSRNWGDLMTALAKAQGEIEGAKKDSTNPHFKSNYADLASVWSAIREPLAKNGLAITQWPRVVSGAVEIETILAFGEQFISDVLWMPCTKMDAHGIGSAITYGRRYALMAIAGVAPEDDDANAAVGHPGSAGGGTEFRPPGPRRQSSWGDGGKPAAVAEAARDGLTQGAAPKPLSKATPPKATPAEAKAAKVKAATDKRVEALKSQSVWTRAQLDQFWAENKDWIDWMADPNNDVLAEYERFTTKFADAEETMREST